jgi:RNA polymerase sigma-70 factor (ECF subfamily)
MDSTGAQVVSPQAQRGPAPQSRGEFEALFNRSHQRAYNLAYRLTGNESDAEDLTQDAFVRAWAAFDRYDRKHSFEVWLLRILSNLAIDRWRRQSLIRTHSLDQSFRANDTDVQLGALVPDRAPGPEQQVILRAQGEQIHAALQMLPDNYRTAIILTDIEEWSYEEVAQKMRCPVGTVRSRLHRGRQLLRQHLSDMQASDVLLPSSRLSAAASLTAIAA